MFCTLISRSIARVGGIALVAVGGLTLTGGCETKSFLDPAQVGRWETEPLVVPIMDNLNVGADEADAQFSTAREVTQEDLVDNATDYVVSPNDLISVSITDLVAPGVESTKTIRVSQTGKITLPLLPQAITATGLTEQQLEAAIRDAYKDAQVITNAQVTVAVVEPRGRTYSVLGAVGQPNLYQIFDTDFRVLEALVNARDVTNPVGIDTIYVIRKKKLDTAAAPANGAPAVAPATTPTGADPLAPQSALPTKRKSQMLMQDGKAPEGNIVVIDGKEVVINPAPSATNPVDDTAPTTTETGAVATETPVPETDGKFEFNSLKEPEDRVVIRIPYKELKSGQLKYNIVIKPGDLIFVPQPVVGEYYMGGNVQAPGAYSLTARKITLTQAVVAARGLNDVAWPSRTEVIRRLPGDKQVIVRVDLDKIFSGLEPDLYVKPDDRVNVGTNAIAPFLAAFRNGFRMTYGFGFLYDKNWADDDDDNN